jgi:hypothetical protein
MPQFEQFDPTNDGNKSNEEIKRLYGNDLSANKFATKPYEAASSLPENIGLFGEKNDKSAEEKIYEKITPDEDAEKKLAFGKLSNDYLNGLGEKPRDMTIEQVRASALLYRESLSEEEQLAEDKKAAKLIQDDIKEKAEFKYAESTDLKPGVEAQATPNPLETTKLNRRSLWDYITGKKERA